MIKSLQKSLTPCEFSTPDSLVPADSLAKLKPETGLSDNDSHYWMTTSNEMRESIQSFLDDCLRRKTETALVARQGLRQVRWTYEQLAMAAYQFARELETRQINPGDRVMIWSENRPEWIAVFYGCLLRGVVVVPFDVQSAPDFVARVQQQVSAKLLLTGDEIKLPGDFVSLTNQLRFSDLSEVLAHHSTCRYQNQGGQGEDLAEIIFTSGTTAEPKGVCLTHRNILTNLAPIEREINKYRKYERPFHPVRFLNLVPLSHVFGQFMGIFIPQLLGGEVHFQDSLNPAEIIETTRKHRISVIVAVPRQLETLRDKIERDYAAHSELDHLYQQIEQSASVHWTKRWWMFRRIHHRFGWKFWAFVAGGATLPADTENFWQRLGFAVVQGYGMTETASLISVNHPFKLSHGSIGKTLPGHEVKLSDAGEILVRGENVAAGYWQNGQMQSVADHEGWLRTGDVGALDSEGNLFFKGRSKDVIVTAAGLNIYPEDLEAALNAQPEIRESSVIAIETAQGAEPMAVVIPRELQADVKAAIHRANESLAEHQQIRHWTIWPEADFPRTPTQKVRKRDVKATLDKETRRQGDKGKESAGGSLIGQLIANVSSVESAQVSSSATLSNDLKLDSLGRVELLSALEDRFQIQLDEAAITSSTTVADLEKLIAERKEETSSTTAYPYPRWAQRWPVTWIRLIVYYLLMLPVTALMGWPRVRGKEHLRNLRGPVLFVSNHVAMVDQSLIQTALPTRFRHRLAIAMEGERLRNFRHPVFLSDSPLNWLLKLRYRIQYFLLTSLINVFPLPQQSGFRRSFSFLGETMDRGYSVLVFPEGRRTDDGKMAAFKSGIGLLATSVDAPIVPIRIDGLFELRQRRSYFNLPGKVTITFGEPVRFKPEDNPAKIARELATRVAEL